jgi:hypothetical protein
MSELKPTLATSTTGVQWKVYIEGHWGAIRDETNPDWITVNRKMAHENPDYQVLVDWEDLFIFRYVGVKGGHLLDRGELITYIKCRKER